MTDRLRLVAADAELSAAHARSDAALGRALGVEMAEDWPPEYNTAEQARWVHARLTQHPDQAGWWSWYVLLGQPELAVAVVGLKGPPVDGVVEIGYSVVGSHQRRGIASEAVSALIEWASDRGVTRVQAATLPHLAASIAVLEKLGFARVPSADPDTLRFSTKV